MTAPRNPGPPSRQDAESQGTPVASGAGESSGQPGADWMAERLHPAAPGTEAGRTPFEQLERPLDRDRDRPAGARSPGQAHTVESHRGKHK